MSWRFKVIVPSYNSLKWIKKTLDSIKKQAYSAYDVCVIDDASTQVGQQDLIAHYCQTATTKQQRWHAILHTQNQGALANIVEGIKALNPTDEDVILLVDGDDWLYNKQVFSKIAMAYQQQAVLMTYGQFVTYPRWQKGWCRPISTDLLNKKNFRQADFVFSHLRTFKYKIWKLIKEHDLKDDQGNYFKTAWDLAILYPLLEMTGGTSCQFIEEFLYVYNMANPLNDCIAHTKLQADTANFIRAKQPYAQLFDEPCRPYQKRMLQEFKNRWVTLYRKVITPQVYALVAKKGLKKFSKAFF